MKKITGAEQGQFKKGTSGNLKGRPPVIAELRELARQHVPSAIRTLVEISNNKKASATARVAASNSIIDRAFGKPNQAISVEAAQQVIPCINISVLESNDTQSLAIAGISTENKTLGINS